MDIVRRNPRTAPRAQYRMHDPRPGVPRFGVSSAPRPVTRPPVGTRRHHVRPATARCAAAPPWRDARPLCTISPAGQPAASPPFARSSRDSNRHSLLLQRVILGGLLVLLCAAAGWTGWILYRKSARALDNMTDDPAPYTLRATLADITNPRSYEKLRGFSDGRINILLLGRANTFKGGKDLTDTIMLASINTVDYRLGLFSIPRDLLVTHNGRRAKINTLYAYGLRDSVGTRYITDTITDITGQPVHYYIVMDFEGFTEIIDILDGINVDVPHDIKDTRYPGPGYSYETFEVRAGLQHFDGATALKYARTRHDKEGDFGRAKRQQQVMQAARNKAFSLGTIVNPIKISEIIDVVGSHVHMNVGGNDIEPLISLMKKVDTQNITTVVIDAWQPDSLLVSARSGGVPGLLPRIGSYREIRERATELFDLNKIAQRRNDIVAEQPSVTLVNRSGNADMPARVAATLTGIGFERITHATIRQRNDAAATVATTTVTDTTNGEKPFSLDELMKKLPATKSGEHVDVGTVATDFVVTLGTDITDAYTYTAISQEELERESLSSDELNDL